MLYPNGYNDEYEITRYFSLCFIDAEEVIAGLNFDEVLRKTNGDGIVYAVITNEENREEVERIICGSSQNRILFIVSSMDFDVNHLSRKYDAIKTFYQLPKTTY